MLLTAQARPAPYGGAVKLTLTSDQPGDEYALILATDSPTPPNPVARGGARVVHEGRLPMHAGARVLPFSATQTIIRAVSASYLALDLQTRELPDGATVHYHCYSVLASGYGPPLSVQAVPGCVRRAAVTLARDLVKARLEYHLARGQRDGSLPGGRVIAVLEMETLEEGFNLPAVLIKESASPAPSAETVGKGGESYQLPGGQWQRETTHQTQARVDLLVLTPDPELRALLEAYLHGIFEIDIDYYQAAGLENAEVSRNIQHTVDPAGTNYYSVELTLTGTLPITVIETQATLEAVDIVVIGDPADPADED